MSKNRFAICLFESGINELTPNELIAGEKLVRVNFKGDTKIETLLYQRKSEVTTPGWVEIVKEFGDFDEANLKTASSGAILFVKISDRMSSSQRAQPHKSRELG